VSLYRSDVSFHCLLEFLPRYAMHCAGYAIARFPSVRLSVCLSVCQYVSKKLVSRFIDGATCSSEPIPIRRKFSPLVYCLHYYNSAATAAAKELILVACVSLFVTLLSCRIARKTIRPTPIVMEQQVMGTRLGLYMLGQNCQNQHLWT